MLYLARKKGKIIYFCYLKFKVFFKSKNSSVTPDFLFTMVPFKCISSNSLTSKSDQHLISPYNITPESNIRVTRI